MDPEPIATVNQNFLARTLLVLLATATVAFAQWTQQSPATSPSARSGAAIEYVPQNGGLVMFGGISPLINDQTWTFDGNDWTQLSPTTSPSARFGTQLVYDYARGVAVLYGGLATNISIPPPNNETWEWDGTNWAQAAPANNPGNRSQYGASYDLVTGRTVMYGGTNTQLLSIPNSQTWEYDGSNWTQVATPVSPGPRERPAMCYHVALAQTLLFGGGDGFGVTDETWLYDGSTGTWQQVAITGAKPPARNAAKLAYDSQRNLSVLSGGQDFNGPLADTWTFDGTTWTEQPTTTQAVRDHAFAFLPTIAQAVKFGGFASAPNGLSNQTWTIGSGIYGSGCAGTNGVPMLTATSAPRIGSSWTMNVDNLNPSFNLAAMVLGLTKVPGVDLGPLLNMPGCAAFTTPDALFSLSGSAGQASWTWPAVSGLPGNAIYAQALCLDPTVNGFGFTISNALYATIGN